jgi:hypothetical protein
LIAEAHPDWHVAGDERIGDLLVVAGRGHVFVEGERNVEATLPGNHGGPGERDIPLVISGGHPRLRRLAAASPARAVDVGATIAAMLDLPLPTPPDGVPQTGDAIGRALSVWDGSSERDDR